jgi:hypothetical protein
LVACLAGSARPVIAQERARTTSAPSASMWPPSVDVQSLSLVQGLSLPVRELVGAAQPAQRGSSRDTLKNGAILGAVVGAVGLGAFGAFICRLHQEEGGASCLADSVRVAAIGAAIGIGAGVAVDAALSRNAGVMVRIRVKF